MRRICVTGPESTGKTTLALRLAAALHVPWVPEASRLHAERLDRELTVDDVEPIAREHIALAEEAASRSGTIVLDTDLVSTLVYGEYYYGFSSPWLEREARARLADVYLLCDVDVPWIPDGIRDQPLERDGMRDRFAQALAALGANTVVISGGWEERWALALGAVSQLAP